MELEYDWGREVHHLGYYLLICAMAGSLSAVFAYAKGRQRVGWFFVGVGGGLVGVFASYCRELVELVGSAWAWRIGAVLALVGATLVLWFHHQYRGDETMRAASTAPRELREPAVSLQ